MAGIREEAGLVGAGLPTAGLATAGFFTAGLAAGGLWAADKAAVSKKVSARIQVKANIQAPQSGSSRGL